MIIEGVDGSTTAGDDDFTITNPAGANPVAITDGHGTGVTVTATNPAHGRLHLATRGGDDEVVINLAGARLGDRSDHI